MTIIDLPTSKGYKFRIDKDKIMELSDEIEEFIISEPSLKKVKFKKEIPKDIQSNNKIEGIDDDLDEINRIIKRRPVYNLIDGENNEIHKRVLNLYEAYKYILKKKDINKDTLRELYSLISDGLISERDLKYMGEYYREDAVCITNKPYFDEKNEGINYKQLDEYINRLFDYINTTEAKNYTDYFTISQIIHFYFVYVHPYFDCNGRTSRTVSMWYLLNNNANAFLNFNRSIPFTKGKYNRVIQSTRNTCDLSHFVKYMLEIEKSQLEKEYIINSLEKNIKDKFTDEEYLLLEYFLSNNQNESLLSLTQMFNSINDHNFKVSEVEGKLKGFIDKGIMVQDGCTKKLIYDGRNNPIYKLNKELITVDKSKIKRLQLSNYINK